MVTNPDACLISGLVPSQQLRRSSPFERGDRSISAALQAPGVSLLSIENQIERPAAFGFAAASGELGME